MLHRFFRHLLGMDKRDQAAHDIKNQVQRDVLKIALEMRELRDTAQRIARATGRIG